MAVFSVYVSCSMIVLGTIGNILSAIIWRHGQRCHGATGRIYFQSLALNDLFIILSMGIEFVLLREGINIRQHLIVCKAFLYGAQFAPQISAWITVVIAFERMLYVCFPIRMYQSNVKRRSVIVISLIVLFSLCLNILEVIVPEMGTVYSILGFSALRLCSGRGTKLENVYYLFRAISYGIFTFLIPFVIITSSNTVMLIKLCSQSQTLGPNLLQRTNVVRITKVVIGISGLHCLSTIPYAILQFSFYVSKSASEIVMELANITFLFNSGFNFVVYCLCGSDFRQDLKTFCVRVCKLCKCSCCDKQEEAQSRSLQVTRF